MSDCKKCSKCGEEKCLNEFHKTKGTKDGHRGDCKICRNLYLSSYRKNNPQLSRPEYQRKYREQNKERIKQLKKDWAKNNPEKIKAAHKKYRAESPVFKLSRAIRGGCRRISHAIKQKKELNSLEYLGCTLEEFKDHIESQWQEGMSWDNHGLHGWHIDHIKPIDWYIKHSDDPWQANHYTNLQPLWAEENLLKGNNII